MKTANLKNATICLSVLFAILVWLTAHALLSFSRYEQPQRSDFKEISGRVSDIEVIAGTRGNIKIKLGGSDVIYHIPLDLRRPISDDRSFCSDLKVGEVIHLLEGESERKDVRFIYELSTSSRSYFNFEDYREKHLRDRKWGLIGGTIGLICSLFVLSILIRLLNGYMRSVKRNSLKANK